jgi:hypothetical membrane protein
LTDSKLALGGVVGPGAFVVAWVVAGAVTGGYSPVDGAISDLAAVGASTRVAMTAGFLVFGIGLIAFGVALRSALEGPAWIAAEVTGACTIAVAATPLGGWSGDTVHAIFAGAGYAAIIALPILASWPFARRGRRDWALASRVIGIVAALCLAATTLGSAHGLWQRLGLTVADAWIFVTALALVRASGPFTETSGREVVGPSRLEA